MLDIEKFARIAHKHDVPLIIDNTFATPILCKPIQYGADIVVHSTSKYMDGHASVSYTHLDVYKRQRGTPR